MTSYYTDVLNTLKKVQTFELITFQILELLFLRNTGEMLWTSVHENLWNICIYVNK